MADQPRAIAEPAPTARPRVLVVEDEAVIATDLAAIVREFGYEVVGPCMDGAEAVDLLAALRPDAALLDYMLPDGGASQVAQALASAGVPFAVVTAHDPEFMLEPGFASVPVLEKPYRVEEITQVVVAALLGSDTP